MSFIRHDYKCFFCLHTEPDMFVRKSEMHHQGCPNCGNNMSILPCAPKVDWDALAMGDSASPEAIRHWEKKKRQKLEQEKKEAL